MDRALTLNMRAILASIVLGTALLLAQTRVHSDDWTFYVTSDTCPDYTWGSSEKDTRTAMAELVLYSCTTRFNSRVEG
jgi:hypothetical protein